MCGARVQEEGKLQLRREVELLLEVAQLRVFRGEEQAVVVEADLAEGDRVAGLGGLLREGAQRGEQGGWAARVLVELVGGAGVDADGGVAEAGCGETKTKGRKLDARKETGVEM